MDGEGKKERKRKEKRRKKRPGRVKYIVNLGKN